MRPLNVSPGIRIDLDPRRVAGVCSCLRSFSTTLATRRTRVMSTTSTTGAFCETNAPGIDRAARDEAVDRRRDDGVGEVDAQLVEARLRLRASARAPDRAARPPTGSALRCRRASAWAAAGARTGCASARRWSSASCRSASRWRIVASDTSCAASACLTCSRISKSSILAMRWPRFTRSPSRTLMSCSRPAVRGATATVASPIRLPTTVISSAIDARVHLRELDRHRPASAAAAATKATAAGESAAAATAQPPPPPPRRPPRPSACAWSAACAELSAAEHPAVERDAGQRDPDDHRTDDKFFHDAEINLAPPITLDRLVSEVAAATAPPAVAGWRCRRPAESA